MGRDAGGGLRARQRAVALVSGAVIVTWAVPVLLMLTKGFAVQDEGTYVLSYRWWSSNPYFVSGSQYFYGPIFEALGESIPALRLLRLVMVLGVNAWFGWAFVTWLDTHRSGPPLSSRTSLVLLFAAAGGACYLWEPLTPGYYDLAAEASVAMVALLLSTLRAAPRPGVVVPWVTGVVATLLVVTKWTAWPVPVITICVATWALARTQRSSAVRYVVQVAAGVALSLLVMQVLLVPLGRFGSAMLEVSRLTATASHSLGYLARFYLRDVSSFAVGAVLFCLPLLAGYLLARRADQRGESRRAGTWLVGAAVVTVVALPLAVGWHGGTGRGRTMVIIALSGLLAALVIGLLPETRGPLPAGRVGWAVAGVLLLVPVFQAVGTNVPLAYVILTCASLWVALPLLVVSHLDRGHLAVGGVLAGSCVFVVAIALLAGSTTLVAPFKAGSFDTDSTRVPGLGVSVSPELARQYAALQTALRPYVRPGVTPILTLDQMAGVTYLLGGAPAGSTWTDRVSPARTAGLLELACRNGDVQQQPVLIVARPVDDRARRALASCGHPFPDTYRRLAVPGGSSDLKVWVPRSSGG